MNNLLSAIKTVKDMGKTMRETIKICFMEKKVSHEISLAILKEMHLQHLVVYSERDEAAPDFAVLYVMQQNEVRESKGA